MEALREYGSEADNAEITAKLRDIRLAEIHEQVMDELLNGPERRRKGEKDREYERQMVMQSALAQQQAVQQKLAAQQNAYGQYQNQLGQYQNAAGAQGLVGKSATLAILDEYANIANTGNISVASQIEPTLSSSTINAIKKALKL
jgi:hypothetical protein